MQFTICARADCGERFATRAGKLYHSERCRRIVANRRYRARRTEPANCKRCGARFSRSATSARKRVYCSPDCQAENRSEEYRNRPDIREGLVRAREVRRVPAASAPVGQLAELDPATERFLSDDYAIDLLDD